MNPFKYIAALLLVSVSAHAATFPIVYAFTNQLWYTNSAADPKTVVSVVVQTTGAVPNSLTISTFQGGQSNLAFSASSATNFRAAVWASATNDYAVKLFTGDRILIAQTFTNRAFATISLLTSPDSSSGGGAVRVIASGVTNSSAGAIILTGDGVGLHSQSGSNSTLVIRADPTNVISERVTMNELEWDSTLFTSPEVFRAGYINAVGHGTGTDPGTPRGSITLVKSGSGDDYTVATRFIYGVNGAIVTNDANGNTVVDGGSTNTVSAFFPKSGTSGVGRLYFSAPASPNNYTYVDLLSTNPGSIIFNGTNLYLGQLLLSTASNTVLFSGQLPAYYQDFQQITNFAVMEDGATIATRLLGINGGTNVTISMETWTNSSGTVGQRATISAGGGGSNYLLYSANTWAESNAFLKTLVAPQITLNGPGRSMSGVNSTVGIRGTNLVASGAHSTAAGGRSATASGDDSVVAGGNANAASGTAGAVGGGTANTASGYASSVPGGANNTASGDYSIAAILQSTASGPRSAAFGTYLNAAGTDTVVFGIGQAATNPLTRYGPRRMYVDSYQTNMGLSVGTTNATHLVEVGGTVRAAYFVGDGSGITGLSGGVVTGVETAVVYTNFDLLYLTSNGALRLYLNTSTFNTGLQYQDTRGFTNTGGVRLQGQVTLGGANLVTVPYGFAAGLLTTASGADGANANGFFTEASGASGANVNGLGTEASGANGANANGSYTAARGTNGAWANGYNTVAAGNYSSAAGGSGNGAYGNGSFAAGVKARATNHGSFVWSDHNTGSYVVSPTANTFTVRATNGWYSTQDTAAPALVIRGNTHYGDGSGLTNIVATGSATDAVKFVASGSVTAAPTTVRFDVGAGSSVTQSTAGAVTTIYVPAPVAGSGPNPTSSYGVVIVGADTNTFITDPGSVSNLVLMSSGPGFIPQFRAHPWASTSSLNAAVGALSNATFSQGWAPTSSVTAAANSANATSLQGIAWSAATPSIGWFPVMTANGWEFTNAAPSSSTGSAVNSISAGTNTMYGNLSVVGTGNVVATSSAAQDGSFILSANSWYMNVDGSGNVISNAAARLTGLSAGTGNSDSGTNNVSLTGGTTFGAGAAGNVSAGQAITFGNAVMGSFASGTNNTQNGSYAAESGRENYNSGNYSAVNGYQNRNEAQLSAILGGWGNTNGASSIQSVIGGGNRNRIAASAPNSAILGGTNNYVQGAGGQVIGHNSGIGSTGTYGVAIGNGVTNLNPSGTTIGGSGIWLAAPIYIDRQAGVSVTNLLLRSDGVSVYTQIVSRGVIIQ